MIHLRTRKVFKASTPTESGPDTGHKGSQETLQRNKAQEIRKEQTKPRPSSQSTVPPQPISKSLNEESVVVGKERGGRKATVQDVVIEAGKDQKCRKLMVLEKAKCTEETVMERSRLALSEPSFPLSKSGGPSDGITKSGSCEQTKTEPNVKRVKRAVLTNNAAEGAKKPGRKRGRKPLSEHGKKVTKLESTNSEKQKSDGDVDSVELNQVRTIHVRVRRIKHNCPKSTEIPSAHLKGDDEKMVPERNCREEEGETEERNEAADMACLKMKLRSSTKVTCRPECLTAEVGMQDHAELNAVYKSNLKSLCNPFAHLEDKDEQKTIKVRSQCIQSPLLEEAGNAIKYSATYSCPHSANRRNPVVKLHNCSNLQKLLNCSGLKRSSFKLGKMFAHEMKEPDLQEHVHHSDTGASVSNSHSAIGKELVNTEGLVPVEGKATILQPNPPRKRLKRAHWDLGRKVRKTTCSDETLKSETKSVDVAEEQHRDMKDEHAVNTETASSCTGLMEDLIRESNNNRSEYRNVILEDVVCDQNTSNKTEEHFFCPPVEFCGTQTPLESKDERHNIDFLESEWSAVITMSLESSNVTNDPGNSPTQSAEGHSLLKESVEEYEAFFCQRTIPFSGKSIWTCSCARTRAWTFPRRSASVIQTTDVLGLDSLLSREGYANDTTALESNVVESLQEMLEEADRETVCKNKRLPINLENVSLNLTAAIASCSDGQLGTLIDKELTSVLISGNVSAADEAKRKDETLQHSHRHSTSIENVENIQNCTAKKYVKSKHLITSVIVPESYKIIETVKPPDFKIPLRKSKIDRVPKLDRVCVLDAEQSYAVEPEKNVPISMIVQKNRPNDISAASATVSQMPKPEIVNEYLPQQPWDASLGRNVHACDNQTSRDNKSSCPGYEVGTSKDHTLGVEHSRTKLCDAKDSSTDTFLNVFSLMPVASPKDKKYLGYSDTQDVLNAYEDDILVLDVIQDDPDLFGYADREESCIVKPVGVIRTTIAKSKLLPSPCKLSKQEELQSDDSKDVTKSEENSAESCMDYGNAMLTDVKVDLLSRCSSLAEGTEESFEEGQLTESDEHRDCLELVEEECKIPVKDERENSHGTGSSSLRFEDFSPSESLPQTSHSLLHPMKLDSPPNSSKPLSWLNDFRFPGKNISPLDMNLTQYSEPWRSENYYQPIQRTFLPLGYCFTFFNTFHGCLRIRCCFHHIPKEDDEMVCMKIVQKLVNENHTMLLKRAVWIFANYYRSYSPGVHYDAEVQTNLLNSMLNRDLWQEIFNFLHTGVVLKVLPSVEVVIKLFEHMASAGLRMSVPSLVTIFCKFVEAGMKLKPGQSNCIISAMNTLQPSQKDINMILAMKSRFEVQYSEKNFLYDLDLAIAEIEHCKEKGDWMKLGTLYLNVRTGCEDLADLNTFSNCIAEALMKDSKEERQQLPFCVFADTVYKDSQLNEVDKNILGRIGISMMYHYHRNELWKKGKRVLQKLRLMQIQFTVLKGLTGKESVAPRCQVVNIAAEIFLKTGSLDSAMWVLKESEWIINTTMWPCDRMDVLNRHNLLYTIAHETLAESNYTACFNVLQNLPGFQNSKSDVNVSQYSILFNKLLGSCVENKSLGISSTVADFMVTKNIQIDFFTLRELITALGKSCLWSRARAHYKCAVKLGCYPLLEGDLYNKLLRIPSSLSEIEMLLAIESFVVSNASSIQSPEGPNHTLQIVLKRSEEDNTHRKESYQTAVNRMIQATRLSMPRLLIKHMTVTIAMEQVYILDHSASFKWLNENMKWARKVWHFH
ncbi:hypothetical protein FKM82_006861 [Ascaphus truei]